MSYSFTGQEHKYGEYRPKWTEEFALWSLKQAGIESKDGKWIGTQDGAPPTVVSIGAGSGNDATPFKALGCKVILIDPNEKLLGNAKKNLLKIAQGEAEFHVGNATHTGIAPRSADLIVIAQALHTMRDKYTEKETASSEETNAEEMARKHWETLLKDQKKPRVAIWYNTIDPQTTIAFGLDTILRQNSAYAASGSTVLEPRYYNPKNFQPYMRKEDMSVSQVMPLAKMSLTRKEMERWIKSYSFMQLDPDAWKQIDTQMNRWFDLYRQEDQQERINIPFVGVITQGKLRDTPFPMREIEREIDIPSPLTQPSPYSQAGRGRSLL